VPGDPQLETDLDVCAGAGVGSVVLFDVDVPRFRALVDAGMDSDDARWAAARNVRSPGQVEALCGYLRERLGPELVILVDQEGGRVSRLRAERGFRHTLPSAAEFARLGASERRDAARRQARELADLGIDGNLAPVVDLGLRPEGPLSSKGRTFSPDPDVVIACARDVLTAHRAEGLATCLKHFPGLGSADLDTHQARPVLGAAFDPDVELAPYRVLLGDPAPPDMVMAAHAVWAAVDPERTASTSPVVLGSILRGDLGFEGVIATDSLDMAGAGAGGSVPAAVDALIAGADLLMDAVNLGGPAEGLPHPARALAEALAEVVAAGALAGGWDEIDRRAARVRGLRRTE
jgi:beta-N-acetylhexosaminidase